MSILLVALAVSSISFTVTVAGIFSPFREWVSKFHSKLEELIFCPYCFSHYVALFLLLIMPGEYSLYEFIITYFAIIAISGLVHYVLLRAYEPVAKTMMFRKSIKK